MKCQTFLFYSTRKSFLKKISQCRKTLEEGPFLWDFSTYILSQTFKEIEDETIWWKKIIWEKTRTVPKKIEMGGHFSLAQYCMLRGKK